MIGRRAATEPWTTPLRVAAADVGSNAIRFAVAEFSEPARYRTLREQRLPIRLGRDAFRSGELGPESLDAAAAAFHAFRACLAAYDVVAYRAVGTSALRESRNAEVLVERIRAETGLRLEVIDDAEEARLVCRAVGSRIRFGRGRWVLAELGGGSVEVSVVVAGGIRASESLPLGSVRLLSEVAGAGGDVDRLRARLAEGSGALRLPAAAREGELAGFVATGGNIEALAKLAGARPDAAGVSRLGTAQLRALTTELARLTFRQRVEDLSLREDRADVIVPAALVYLRLAELARAEQVLVPHVGLKHGVLLELAGGGVGMGGKG